MLLPSANTWLVDIIEHFRVCCLQCDLDTVGPTVVLSYMYVVVVVHVLVPLPKGPDFAMDNAT